MRPRRWSISAPYALKAPSRQGIPAARPVAPYPSRPVAPKPPLTGYVGDEDATQYTDVSRFRSSPPPSSSAAIRGGTQTLDLDELQEIDPHLAPYSDPAGFEEVTLEGGFPEESTQFVSLDQLQAPSPGSGMPSPLSAYDASAAKTELGTMSAIGASAAKTELGTMSAIPNAPGSGQQGMPPQSDPLLTQSYHFTPDAIQQYGHHTLIFARNQQGQDVVLKRIWAGHSSQMPEAMHHKVSLLGQLKHPHLAGLNGIFDSHSGCWAELQRPPGIRLSHILQSGPQKRVDVALWAYPVADAIQAVHAFSMLYANLTPDAIWIDEETRTILLEPFDLLAFEDRGALGVYGPPELHTPGNYPPNPATDVYSFAAVIVAALTAVPDPNQVGLIEHQKSRQELVRALELNPSLRPSEFEPILSALGGRIDLHPEPKKGFDKRLLIPLALLVPALIYLLFFFGQEAPPPPIEYTQAGLPEMPAPDRVALAEAPGATTPVEQVTILTSYVYNPPQPKEDPFDQADVDTSGHAAQIARHLQQAAQYPDPRERDEEYVQALKLMRELKLKGEMSDAQREAYTEAMADEGLGAYRASLIKDVSEPLKKGDFDRARTRYKTIAIDPEATASDFFVNTKKADIVPVKISPDAPKKEPQKDN